MGVGDLTDIELVVLQRALLEARFCERNRDESIWLSPVVIDLHDRVIKLAMTRAQESGRVRELAQWETWLDWSTHVVEQRILAEKIRSEESWICLTDDESRAVFLRRVLRPFRVSDEALAATLSLIREVSSETGTPPQPSPTDE